MLQFTTANFHYEEATTFTFLYRNLLAMKVIQLVYLYRFDFIKRNFPYINIPTGSSKGKDKVNIFNRQRIVVEAFFNLFIPDV